MDFKSKHELYFRKGLKDKYFDFIYTQNDCKLHRILEKIIILKIVDIDEFSQNLERSGKKSFLFQFKADTKSSSLTAFHSYLASNTHKAGFAILDSKGTVGLLTHHSYDLEGDLMSFKSYLIDPPTSSTNLSNSSSVNTIETVGGKRSHPSNDFLNDPQNDMNDLNGFNGETETGREELDHLYDVVVSDEHQGDDEYQSKRAKHEEAIFNIGTKALKGNAPDFSKIKSSNEISKFGDLKETDEVRIQARKKQIMFGKNTTGYDNYIAAVPKNQRKSFKEHPRTPDPYLKTSKRGFDGIVKAWRRKLHEYDNVDKLPSLNVDKPKNNSSEMMIEPLHNGLCIADDDDVL